MWKPITQLHEENIVIWMTNYGIPMYFCQLNPNSNSSYPISLCFFVRALLAKIRFTCKIGNVEHDFDIFLASKSKFEIRIGSSLQDFSWEPKKYPNWLKNRAFMKNLEILIFTIWFRAQKRHLTRELFVRVKKPGENWQK